jgi:CcmD family protein
MLAGYAVIFLGLGGYVASLVWRMRGLKKLLKTDSKNAQTTQKE